MTTVTGHSAELDHALAHLRSAVEREDRQGYHSSLLGAARAVLALYDGAQDQVLDGTLPVGLVATTGSKRGRRYGLHTKLAKGEPVTYVLDVPLQSGDTVQLSDVGELPANLEAVVRGTTLRFQINVQCQQCWDRGSHLVQVPSERWSHHPSLGDPFLVRRCVCGHTWRQYTGRG